MPIVRRVPPILLTKMRRELSQHFTENEADGVRVLVWAHKQFKEVAKKRYLCMLSKTRYLHSVMVEFFVGKWSEGREKPFRISELQRQRMQITEKEGRADRKVPGQPNVFVGKDSVVSR